MTYAVNRKIWAPWTPPGLRWLHLVGWRFQAKGRLLFSTREQARAVARRYVRARAVKIATVRRTVTQGRVAVRRTRNSGQSVKQRAYHAKKPKG